MNIDPAHARHQGHRRVHRPGQDAEHDRLPAEHHPEHRRRRLRQGRDPAGAAVRGAVRLRAAQVRRARHAGVRLHREDCRTCCSSIVGIIMQVAPIGAFGAMAFTIGKYGVGSLLSLGKLMGTFYLTCLVFIFVVLGLDRALARLLDLEVHPLHQGRAADRARHVVVGIGAAADDGEAGEPRRARSRRSAS